MKLEFSQQIFYKTLKFPEIYSLGVELFHANGRSDGQTDLTNLRVAFRSFANASENCEMKQ